ncbi:MAG: thioredoxin fold domain-containing protein [Puia sp.]
MRVVRVSILVFVVISVKAQENGIRFESGLSWNQIKAKAKAEHKDIFMDCYATWCSPCKYMNSNIFPQKAVGDYFNAHFINVSMQFDKTKDDSKEIRDWYITTDSIRQLFKINKYPTYLFFSNDGKPLHQSWGSTDKEEFLKIGKDAVDPEKQSYTLIDHWKEHQTDSAFLFNTLASVSKIGSDEMEAIVNAYLRCLKNPVTRDNLKLFDPLIHSSKDKLFILYLNNMSEIDSLIGSPLAEETLSNVIFKEEIRKLFAKQATPVNWSSIPNQIQREYKQTNRLLIQRLENLFQQKINDEIVQNVKENGMYTADWATLYQKLGKRFPCYDFNSFFLSAKLDYYRKQKDSTLQAKTASVLINKYGSMLGDRKANDIIFSDIFNVTGNSEILEQAVEFMSSSVARTPDPDDYDTYANLLYKTGNLDDAINWENKAIELVAKSSSIFKDKDLGIFKETLAKMSRHEKTWKTMHLFPDIKKVF